MNILILKAQEGVGSRTVAWVASVSVGTRKCLVTVCAPRRGKHNVNWSQPCNHYSSQHVTTDATTRKAQCQLVAALQSLLVTTCHNRRRDEENTMSTGRSPAIASRHNWSQQTPRRGKHNVNWSQPCNRFSSQLVTRSSGRIITGNSM